MLSPYEVCQHLSRDTLEDLESIANHLAQPARFLLKTVKLFADVRQDSDHPVKTIDLIVIISGAERMASVLCSEPTARDTRRERGPTRKPSREQPPTRGSKLRDLVIQASASLC